MSYNEEFEVTELHDKNGNIKGYSKQIDDFTLSFDEFGVLNGISHYDSYIKFDNTPGKFKARLNRKSKFVTYDFPIVFCFIKTFSILNDNMECRKITLKEKRRLKLELVKFFEYVQALVKLKDDVVVEEVSSIEEDDWSLYDDYDFLGELSEDNEKKEPPVKKDDDDLEKKDNHEKKKKKESVKILPRIKGIGASIGSKTKSIFAKGKIVGAGAVSMTSSVFGKGKDKVKSGALKVKEATVGVGSKIKNTFSNIKSNITKPKNKLSKEEKRQESFETKIDYQVYKYYKNVSFVDKVKNDNYDLSGKDVKNWYKNTKNASLNLNKVLKKDDNKSDLDEEKGMYLKDIGSIQKGLNASFRTDEKGYLTSDSYIDFLNVHCDDEELEERVMGLKHAYDYTTIFKDAIDGMEKSKLEKMKAHYEKYRSMIIARNTAIVVSLAMILSGCGIAVNKHNNKKVNEVSREDVTEDIIDNNSNLKNINFGPLFSQSEEEKDDKLFDVDWNYNENEIEGATLTETLLEGSGDNEVEDNSLSEEELDELNGLNEVGWFEADNANMKDDTDLVDEVDKQEEETDNTLEEEFNAEVEETKEDVLEEAQDSVENTEEKESSIGLSFKDVDEALSDDIEELVEETQEDVELLKDSVDEDFGFEIVTEETLNFDSNEEKKEEIVDKGLSDEDKLLLETYRTQLESLRSELPESEVSIDDVASIGSYVNVLEGSEIYSNINSVTNHENGKTSYYNDTVPRVVESIVLSDGNTVVNTTSMEEAASLMEMGYAVTGYSVVNPYSDNISDIEGRFAKEDVMVLSLNK